MDAGRGWEPIAPTDQLWSPLQWSGAPQLQPRCSLLCSPFSFPLFSPGCSLALLHPYLQNTSSSNAHPVHPESLSIISCRHLTHAGVANVQASGQLQWAGCMCGYCLSVSYMATPRGLGGTHGAFSSTHSHTGGGKGLSKEGGQGQAGSRGRKAA